MKTLLFLTGELPCNDGSFYDYFWNGEKRYWIPWIKLVPDYEHDPAVCIFITTYIHLSIHF